MWQRKAEDRGFSSSPERSYREEEWVDEQPKYTSSKRKASPFCLALMGLIATALAFIFVSLGLLTPFSSVSSIASLGFIQIQSTVDKPSDGVQSAILTTWGYCTTTTDGVTTCLPATNLFMLGQYATNFTFTPTPLIITAKSYTVTQTLALLPYKANAVLIFTLPIVMSLLGLALLAGLATVLFFTAKRYTNLWVVCAKCGSTLTILGGVLLAVCVGCAAAAGEALAGVLVGVPGVVVARSYAGLALIAAGLGSVMAAAGVTTWSFWSASRVDAELEDLEMEDAGRSVGVGGPAAGVSGKKGGFDEHQEGRGGPYGSRERLDARRRLNDMDSLSPPLSTQQGSRARSSDGRSDMNRSDDRRGINGKRVVDGEDGRRGGDRRVGGSRGRERRSVIDRFSSRSSVYHAGGKDKGGRKVDGEEDGKAEEQPAKSDWGILRTVNGVAGGVYGYFAGGNSAPAEPEPQPEPEVKTGRNASRGQRRDSVAPPARSRKQDSGDRRRQDPSRDRRGASGGDGRRGGGSPDWSRERSRSRR
ncbi:hypothetical protein BC830DRAFT_1085749 [Chytriomyces sp. MP71]|nr:hypothetical protein BC830DRAFT_1085749 [Chytriomyces sp. MP71]